MVSERRATVCPGWGQDQKCKIQSREATTAGAHEQRFLHSKYRLQHPSQPPASDSANSQRDAHPEGPLHQPNMPPNHQAHAAAAKKAHEDGDEKEEATQLEGGDQRTEAALAAQVGDVKKLKEVDAEYRKWLLTLPLVTRVERKRSAGPCDAQDRHGYRPLHDACMSGEVAAVRWLLGQGTGFGNASPGLPATDGITPVHYAAIHGHTDVIRLLIDHGASADVRVLSGVAAALFSQAQPVAFPSPLPAPHLAPLQQVMSNSWPRASAGHWSAARGHAAATLLLLSRGGTVDMDFAAFDGKHGTFADLMARRGHDELADLLQTIQSLGGYRVRSSSWLLRLAFFFSCLPSRLHTAHAARSRPARRAGWRPTSPTTRKRGSSPCTTARGWGSWTCPAVSSPCTGPTRGTRSTRRRCTTRRRAPTQTWSPCCSTRAPPSTCSTRTGSRRS